MGNKKQFQHLKIEFIQNRQERKKQRHRRKKQSKDRHNIQISVRSPQFEQ